MYKKSIFPANKKLFQKVSGKAAHIVREHQQSSSVKMHSFACQLLKKEVSWRFFSSLLTHPVLKFSKNNEKLFTFF